MDKKILLFLKTYDFRKGVLFATLGFLVFMTGNYFFPKTPYGIAMGMGILLSAISDVPGTKKHNIVGIFTGIFLALLSFSVIHLTKHNYWLLTIAIAVLVFLNSYICAYGLRASMVSFSGLLTVALGFVNIGPDTEFYKSSVFIFISSLLYIGISSLINLIKPKQIGEQLVVECMHLTANYLKTRGELATTQNREPLLKKLLELQIIINDKHENLRSIVLQQHSKIIGSGYHRRQLLIFIELVDILELAIANPINYEDIDSRFKNQPEILLPFTKLLNASADLLIKLSYKIDDKEINNQADKVGILLKEVNQHIEDYKNNTPPSTQRRENVILLRNLADYEEKQVQKLETIERIIANDFNLENLEDPLEPKRFITNQDYSLKTLVDNFNFSSIVFKHALRLTLCSLTGFLIGSYLELQNTYWILITIFVIMRPNYGITKLRTWQRVIGTLIGATISFSVIYLVSNSYVYAVITFIAMIFAFAYIQRDYRKAATAITINIIFVFAMLADNPMDVISERIIDTIIGAGLAILFNYFFWPVWEASTINRFLTASLKANKNYIKQISELYIDKKKTITEYKLSRKAAFIQIGNLHAAFQRMSQEPKSRQNKVSELYEVIVIQHTFLSAAAALGTYIQTHKTSQASKYFKLYVDAIYNNISTCEKNINNKKNDTEINPKDVEKANTYLANIYKELELERENEIAHGKLTISKDLQANLKEIKIVYDQLNYLYNLSQQLEKNINAFIK